MRKLLQKNFKKKRKLLFQIPYFSFRNRIFNKRYIEFNYNCKITRDIKFHMKDQTM